MPCDHACRGHLTDQPEDVILEGGQVYVYRACKECGKEFQTTYEYVETHPT